MDPYFLAKLAVFVVFMCSLPLIGKWFYREKYESSEDRLIEAAKLILDSYRVEYSETSFGVKTPKIIGQLNGLSIEMTQRFYRTRAWFRIVGPGIPSLSDETKIWRRYSWFSVRKMPRELDQYLSRLQALSSCEFDRSHIRVSLYGIGLSRETDPKIAAESVRALFSQANFV
ncbi:MAG: hypothetical protein ACXVB9_18820 [Bdellovibrionota bacterium]